MKDNLLELKQLRWEKENSDGVNTLDNILVQFNLFVIDDTCAPGRNQGVERNNKQHEETN